MCLPCDRLTVAISTIALRIHQNYSLLSATERVKMDLSSNRVCLSGGHHVAGQVPSASTQL